MKNLLKRIMLLSAFTMSAHAADVMVKACPKNPKVLIVSISGESSLNIFRALAARIKLTPAQMGNVTSNGMYCEGLKFTEAGDVSEAKCSYLMIKQKNIPYPQVDPGFNREDIIECE